MLELPDVWIDTSLRVIPRSFLASGRTEILLPPAHKSVAGWGTRAVEVVRSRSFGRFLGPET